MPLRLISHKIGVGYFRHGIPNFQKGKTVANTTSPKIHSEVLENHNVAFTQKEGIFWAYGFPGIFKSFSQ